MKPLLPFLLLLFTVSTALSAQQSPLRYVLHKKAATCTEIIDIDKKNDCVYYYKMCGSVAGEQVAQIGVSKLVKNGNLYSLSPITVANFTSVKAKDYIHSNEVKGPAVVFIDMYADTVSIDSLLIYKISGNKAQKIKSISSAKPKKIFEFSASDIKGRTHFTLPFLSLHFFEEMVFEIPNDEKNICVITLNFPKHFIPEFALGDYVYAGLDSRLTETNDSLLVDKKSKQTYKLFQPKEAALK